MPAMTMLRPLLAWFAAMPLLAQGREWPAPGFSAPAREAFAASDGNAEWIAAHGKAVEGLVARVQPDGRVRSSDAADNGASDVAATAAALLALGSDGATMKTGVHRQQVRLATKWLVEQQRADGWFCDPSHDSAGLVHALATAAVVQTCVDSRHRPYEGVGRRAMEPFASAAAEPPLGEPLPLALGAIAARRLGTRDPNDPGSPLGVAPLAALLEASGACRQHAGRFPMVGALPGTQDMATVAVAIACRGTTVFPDDDPRWKVLAARVAEMPTRFGKNGELLDAVTLWCAADLAHQLGGDARAAFERVMRERVVSRLSGATATGSITFACGPKVLRNEAAETALAALALAVPWFRVGR